MQTVRATFDGKRLVPERPLDLPVGSVVEFEPRVAGGPARLSDLASAHDDAPDAPADLASEHDHYLYGVPKRE